MDSNTPCQEYQTTLFEEDSFSWKFQQLILICKCLCELNVENTIKYIWVRILKPIYMIRIHKLH